jgi:protein O-GlcNAc transferase
LSVSPVFFCPSETKLFMLEKTIPIERAVEIASEMHRAGQFQRAEAMYVEILRQDPGNVDAIHLLGVLANQGGRPDVAIELIKRALSKRPGEPLILLNYADALAANGQREEAVSHYYRALEIAPDYLDALNNLSRTLGQLSRFEESATVAERALKAVPDDENAHNNLGNALRAMNRNVDAVPHYEAALAKNPQFVEAMNNLGLALTSIGFLDAGILKLREAINLRPSLAEPHNNLGVILSNFGRNAEAITSFETALKLDPKHLDARNNLAAALRAMGRPGESLKEFEEITKIQPLNPKMQLNYAYTLKEVGRLDDALAATNKYIEAQPESSHGLFVRGLILRELQRPDEAIDAFRAALELHPDRADVLSTLGYALQERGELDEALEVLNKSIAMHADPQTHSNVMMVMCYHPGISPKQHYEAHRAFARAHEDPVKPNWKPHSNSKDPNRRLRIGYFSPDFRGHVVSFFSIPIIQNHQHENFEIFAYSNNFHSDSMTLIQRAKFDHWRETVGLSPDAAAEMIRADEIDILVELAGHTALNGLPVLARKPAPVQINAIGFPSTTGLTAVDYRITDRLCDPPGIAEAHNSEKLLYMPDCFWSYEPPLEQVEVGPLPAERNGYVTFVSVNNFTKVTPQVLGCWAQVLAKVPKSKIILQTSGLSSEFVKSRVREIFKSEGVDEDRIDMRKVTPMIDYLKLLESTDIMLDPFPFNGGTTTCHGLWMGLPVVSLAGLMHAGRMGLSMLSCVGLPELCGSDETEYVEIAANLARDLPRLREIRAGMRDRLRASPLLDGVRYTRNLEAAYRRVWQTWCASPSS